MNEERAQPGAEEAPETPEGLLESVRRGLEASQRINHIIVSYSRGHVEFSERLAREPFVYPECGYDAGQKARAFGPMIQLNRHAEDSKPLIDTGVQLAVLAAIAGILVNPIASLSTAIITPLLYYYFRARF